MTTHAEDVHTPRYIVRKRTVRSIVRNLPAGQFLEMGCGRGEMFTMLHAAGHHGVAVEISESVFPLAVAAARPLQPDIEVVASLDAVTGRKFDYLLAFEVLEHIEDDHGHLNEWADYLRPGGVAVITVPAHKKLWTAADDAVGHIRRYERDDLVALLESNGLKVLEIKAFGYPLVLVTRPLRHLQHRLRRKSSMSTQERTLDSSLDSTLGAPRRIKSLLRIVVEVISTGFYFLGLPLRHTDYGDGYLVVAERMVD